MYGIHEIVIEMINYAYNTLKVSLEPILMDLGQLADKHLVILYYIIGIDTMHTPLRFGNPGILYRQQNKISEQFNQLYMSPVRTVLQHSVYYGYNYNRLVAV